MQRMNLNLEYHRDAYCPICTCDLLQESTRFIWGIAICTPCSTRVTMGQMCAICEALIQALKSGDVSTSKGLTFWTPKLATRPRMSLTLYPIRRRHEDEPVPPIPSR